MFETLYLGLLVEKLSEANEFAKSSATLKVKSKDTRHGMSLKDSLKLRDSITTKPLLLS